MQKYSSPFGRLVKEERTKAGLTRKELAAKIGAEERELEEIEEGGAFPGDRTLINLVLSLKLNESSVMFVAISSDKKEIILRREIKINGKTVVEDLARGGL